MEIAEFVRLDAKAVRSNKELMQLYVDFYEAAFSFKPSCAGCSFKSGFKKLQKYVLSNKKNVKFDKTPNIMKKTFEVKKAFRTKILTYVEDGLTYRKYGHNLDEAFAIGLVRAGKTEYFNVLPKSVKLPKESKENDIDEIYDIQGVKEVDSTKYDSLDYRTELLPRYTELKDKVGKEAINTKRTTITAFLLENEG